jgi:CubicO group peptidase (beta-lactamase class C family)
MLAGAGALDLDAPVASYWPRFAQNSKDGITVRMLLNHQAGLPGLSDPITPDELHDFDAMVDRLEGETPLWAPGTRTGYHPLTFGWLVGEVIRRITGETVGAFFRRSVAEPLDLDFWIGLPPDLEDRVAVTSMTVSPVDGDGRDNPFAAAVARGEAIQVATLNSCGGMLDPGGCDAPGAHAAEIPAANGIANARGLAGMYAPLSLAGAIRGKRFVGQDQLATMAAVESATMCDAVQLVPGRMACGFAKSALGRAPHLGGDGLVLSERAFGHGGLGGSVGFADPELNLAFGYAMNRHPRAGEDPNARFQPLIDATYRSLGRTPHPSGRWM